MGRSFSTFQKSMGKLLSHNALRQSPIPPSCQAEERLFGSMPAVRVRTAKARRCNMQCHNSASPRTHDNSVWTRSHRHNGGNSLRRNITSGGAVAATHHCGTSRQGALWRQLTTAEHHGRRRCGKNSSPVCPKHAARKDTTPNKGKLTTIII